MICINVQCTNTLHGHAIHTLCNNIIDCVTASLEKIAVSMSRFSNYRKKQQIGQIMSNLRETVYFCYWL